MRLKKLILHGFKSFADRTEFVFDAPITGIVGPNGCGKSNVVDGFKWVLGEQSAKSLRGEAMLDVIFNGAAARKPAGMSEVTLVFDNPPREDGTRSLNVEFDEVSVGRRLFRDGASEYTLNERAARLKDIRELFLDTGVGVDAYSVIEQGRVAALLDANPQQRRIIFEEAAGISKFKARRKEAHRKLEKVDQNLLRVNDVVEEVERQLRSVKVQAGRARTYQELSARLSELRLMHVLHEYHSQHAKLQELETRRDDAQFRLDDASGNLARAQNALAEARERSEALSGQRQQMEYELVQARASMQAAQQRQQYARQQLDQIGEQLRAYEADGHALEQKRLELAAALDTDTRALAELTQEVERQGALIEQRQRDFRDGQLQLNALNQQIEQHKAAILDLMRKLAQTNNRLGAIEIERKNILAQQTRLGDRRRVVLDELEALVEQRSQRQQGLDAVIATIAREQQALEACRTEAAHLGKQIAQISENMGSAREHRSGLLSRQKLLADMEAKREGVSEGVKSVLRQRDSKFGFVRGLVADVLRVDVEHAHVIEAALDGRDQLLVSDDSSAVIAAGEAMEELEGRVSVLCTDRLARQSSPESAYDWNRHSWRIRLAVDLVRVEPADRGIAEHLLGRSVIVDSLADAAALRAAGPAGFRYITAAGEVLEADGTLRVGPLTAAMGLLSRRSELEALAQQIGEVDARIEQLSQKLAQGTAEAKALEQQQNQLRNELYKANTTKVELTSQLAQNNDRQASLRREQPILERELNALLEHFGKLKIEESGLLEQRKSQEADQTDRQRNVEESAAGVQHLAETLRHVGEQLTAARIERGQVQEKQLASQQHVQRQKAAIGELAQQIERVRRSAETTAAKRGSLESELQAAVAAESQLARSQAALGEKVADLTRRAAEAIQNLQELTGQVETLRGEHGEVEQEAHHLQLRHGEARVRLESLVQRATDELQLDLPAKYASLTQDAGEFQATDIDWDAVAEEIRTLREKIGRLGNVNLDAIGQQQELEQRQQFLATQVNDLITSKAQLQELIDTINAESSTRFEQTFIAVRENFQQMFRKLFGGGKADIILETELPPAAAAPALEGPGLSDGAAPAEVPEKIDVLDAGIEIIARPPGKQPVTISQLSGGEKTMTCIALLMSIFKTKPSPFCILDEVDAALDEANNQRFNMIVQEFLDQSQFIVITHSKRTMQIADVLYGVTMQEQGVSKRVAVKFDQVDSQGRIQETAAA